MKLTAGNTRKMERKIGQSFTEGNNNKLYFFRMSDDKKTEQIIIKYPFTIYVKFSCDFRPNTISKNTEILLNKYPKLTDANV